MTATRPFIARIKSLGLSALLIAMMLAGQPAQGFDLGASFKLWLLNNEARSIAEIRADSRLIARISTAFAFMPGGNPPLVSAQEKLWLTHHKFYNLLNEIQSIYSIARAYGSGRFGILFQQHRPEIWAVLPLEVSFAGLASVTAIEYRRAFHAALLKALRLDVERDYDLSLRLQRAIKKLSDEEFRLFNDYLAIFSALYPSDRAAKMIDTFVSGGSQKQFAAGLKNFLKPGFSAPSPADDAGSLSAIDADDPLAELEKLLMTPSGSTSRTEPLPSTGSGGDQTTTLEPPPPGVEELFNIWD